MMLKGKILDCGSSRKACLSKPYWVAAFFMQTLGPLPRHRMNHYLCTATFHLCCLSLTYLFHSHLCKLPLYVSSFPQMGASEGLLPYFRFSFNNCFECLLPASHWSENWEVGGEQGWHCLSLMQLVVFAFDNVCHSVLVIFCCITNQSET